MKFSEIANRLTGISTPVGGVSWQPAELEIAGARRVVAFLEDRRVLYDPCQIEVPDHCVRSVLDIRHHLSEELGKLDGGSELAQACGRCVRPAVSSWSGWAPIAGRASDMPAEAATRAGPSLDVWELLWRWRDGNADQRY